MKHLNPNVVECETADPEKINETIETIYSIADLCHCERQKVWNKLLDDIGEEQARFICKVAGMTIERIIGGD